jgi:hypothetical protein
VTAPSYEQDINDQDPEIVLAKAQIARTREAVAASVAALQRELSRTFSWREWVMRRPLETVILAFGVGFLLGTATVHRRRG